MCLGGRWTTERIMIWCGEEYFLRNIHGVAPVAELDGDEVGYLVAKVAEIKRQK
jgi:hypothetical protein